MLQVSINFWAVLVAGVVNMIIGWIWFSSGVFGKSWMKLHGTKKMGNGTHWPIFVELISTLVMMYVFANILKFSQSASIPDGLLCAAIVWVGLIVPYALTATTWQGKPFKLFLIEAVPRLLMLLVGSIILVSWL